MKTAIIVPAFNEAAVIAQTLQDIRTVLRRDRINADLIVVDDGSSDGTGDVALAYADRLLKHKHNCGLGAALATGIEYIKRANYDACVTFDSDGQHDPRDIKKALLQLQSGTDVVIGSRFIGTHSGMPKLRRIILFLGNLVTFMFFGVWTTD